LSDHAANLAMKGHPAMRFGGTITDLDWDLDDYDYKVSDAILAKMRIAIDWEENGEPFHAILASTDGPHFEGHYGSPRPNSVWKLQGTKYTAGKSVLLLLKWFQTDNGPEGVSLFRLEPTGQPKRN
jgi:hypothetical protein